VADTLLIVESPTKAKSLSLFLGKKYVVKASMGHLRDLPKSRLGVEVEQEFKPKYIPVRGKGKIIKELKEAVKNANRILLASDPDREGEAIAWHLQNLLELKSDEPCRVEFNEITKQSVIQALENPRHIDYNRVNAQQARRILDRLVGYNLSPLLWRKIKKGLSAGRVQSAALRLICDREEEIKAFVPEEYWSLTAKLSQDEKNYFLARLYKIGNKKTVLSHQDEVEKIMKELAPAQYQVVKKERTEKSRQPVTPFTTSSLQQEASRRLNFTPQRTMLLAQQLYEGLDLGPEGTTGLITYIRTDSMRVAESIQEEARLYIKRHFGAVYIPLKPRKIKTKGRIQDAHEAIRPTSVWREPRAIKTYLTGDQYKLYNLIWSRFIASQMNPAVIETVTVDISAGRCIFRAVGSNVKFDGFMKVYAESLDNEPDSEPEAKKLPDLKEGELLKLKELIPKQHFTQPPPRYTEATLVKTLEEKGIGRPSTYVPIIDTIQKRGYVTRKSKQFIPTELGIIVTDLLKKFFPNIVDVKFTAEMEEKLDRVEEGQTQWVDILKEFYQPFQQTILRAEAEAETNRPEMKEEISGEACNICGRNMVIKTGRYGKFLACPGFPDCRNVKPFLKTTGAFCPLDGGEIVLRRTKKGRTFYGCKNYPKCNFITWEPPSQEKCPVCDSLMVVKSARGQKETLKCINQECKKEIVKIKEAKAKN